MLTDISIMQKFDSSDYFITPDRKLEQYLHRQGVPFVQFLKGETGWTYWVYDRTPALLDCVSSFMIHRTKRKEMLKKLSEEFDAQREED